MQWTHILAIAILFILTIVVILSRSSFGPISPAFSRAKITNATLNFTDNSLKSQLITTCLKAPSAMAFLGPNDIVVTEKNTGNVVRVVVNSDFGTALTAC